MIRRVVTSRRARKSLEKAPRYVAVKYALWHGQVEEHGLEVVQRISGYHDEPLSGRLYGIRSVRLSQGYRAYYRIIKGDVMCVQVEEVNKHEYKKVERLF